MKTGRENASSMRFDRSARAMTLALIVSLAAVAASSSERETPGDVALSRELDRLFRSSAVSRATVSLEVVDVDTGRVVSERDSHHPILPASNMKVFTTAAALELLTPDYQFRTTLSILGEVERGVLHGDVRVVGGGDPTIGERFHDGNALEVIEEWIIALKKEGIQTIDGNLVFEYGYFDDEWVHPTWPEDQLVRWYQAPVSALSIHEGCVTVRVIPGSAGGAATVEMIPPNDFIKIENSTVTSRRGNGVFVARYLRENTIVVKGSIAPGSGPFDTLVPVVYPVHYFANVTRRAWSEGGIRVLGRTLVAARDRRQGWKTIAEQSTPLAVVAMVVNKRSQNHYAEQILKTIGAETSGEGSWEAGARATTRWMIDTVGVSADEFSQADGSGLSRSNRTSANAFTRLLRHMWKSQHRWDFLSSMPFNGDRDSRLRRKLNREPYARRIYAKTGYLNGVVGLSGYVRAGSGRTYAFSFLVNGYTRGTAAVYAWQDLVLQEIIRNG